MHIGTSIWTRSHSRNWAMTVHLLGWLSIGIEWLISWISEWISIVENYLVYTYTRVYYPLLPFPFNKYDLRATKGSVGRVLMKYNKSLGMSNLSYRTVTVSNYMPIFHMELKYTFFRETRLLLPATLQHYPQTPIALLDKFFPRRCRHTRLIQDRDLPRNNSVHPVLRFALRTRSSPRPSRGRVLIRYRFDPLLRLL